MKKNETLRLIVSIVLGVLILLASILIAGLIAKGKKQPEAVIKPVVKTVFVDTVTNESLRVNIEASGTVEAFEKVELYAEVQGILESSNKAFKEGQSYPAGSTILQINSDEFRASLVAQRSAFYNTLMSALPDLQLDYPTVYPKWKQYVNNLEIERSLSPLPTFDTDQEKYFINSRNIVNTYYTIKNLEERLNKYFIQAPYDGIVTEALVNQGALIRSGQKLGEFINPSQYELRISLSERYIDMVKVGNDVELFNLEHTESFTGKVSRINRIIDPSTQSIEVFIQVSSPKLNDGMYLEAYLKGKEVNDVFEISRALLVDNEEVFTVVEGKLKKVAVELVHFTEETALIKGLKDGTVLLNNNIPGAYDGMLVEIAPL